MSVSISSIFSVQHTYPFRDWLISVPRHLPSSGFDAACVLLLRRRMWNYEFILSLFPNGASPIVKWCTTFSSCLMSITSRDINNVPLLAPLPFFSPQYLVHCGRTSTSKCCKEGINSFWSEPYARNVNALSAAKAGSICSDDGVQVLFLPLKTVFIWDSSMKSLSSFYPFNHHVYFSYLGYAIFKLFLFFFHSSPE